MKNRIAGALRLRSDVYRELRDDRRGWIEAATVIGAVAVAHGLGAIFRAPSQPYAESSLGTFLFGVQGEILLWLGMSGSIYAVARLLLEHGVSFGQVARPLGVAGIPGIGVIVAGVISGQGLSALPILVLIAGWRLAATFIAVKHGLDTTTRAASAYMVVGVIGGIGIMAVGTAFLNSAIQ